MAATDLRVLVVARLVHAIRKAHPNEYVVRIYHRLENLEVERPLSQIL